MYVIDQITNVISSDMYSMMNCAINIKYRGNSYADEKL